MFAKLIVTKKSDPEWLLERVFEQEVISLGRDRSNSIRLADDTKYISRHHCELIRDVEVYRLIDPGSLNQTLLNDVQIAENIPYALRSGDIITIGDYMIEFLYVEEPEVEDAKSEGEIEFEFDEDIIGLAKWLKQLQSKSRGEDRSFRKELLHNAFSMALNDPDITEFGEIFEDVIRDIASNSHPALQEASEPSLPAFEPGSLDAMEDPSENQEELDEQDEITLDNLPNIEEDITLDGIDTSGIDSPSGSLDDLDIETDQANPPNKENRGSDPSNEFADLTFPEDITEEGLEVVGDESKDDSSDSETKEPESHSDSTTEEVKDDSDTELQVDPNDKVERVSPDETTDESGATLDLDSDQSIFIEPDQSITFERIPDQDQNDVPDNSITFEDPDKSMEFDDPDKSITFEDPDKSIAFEDPDKSITFDDPDKSITFEDPDKSITFEDPDKSISFDEDSDESIIFEDPDKSLFIEEDADNSISIEPNQPEADKKDPSEEITYHINSPDDTLIIPEGFQETGFIRSPDETHDDLLNSEYADLKAGDSSDEITFSDEMTNEHVIPAPDATEEDVTPLTLEGQLPNTPRTEIIIIDDPADIGSESSDSEENVETEPSEEIDEEGSAIDDQLFDEDEDTFEPIKDLRQQSTQESSAIPQEPEEESAVPVNEPDEMQKDEFDFSADTTPIEPELSPEDTWINLDDAITEDPIPPNPSIPLLDQMEDPKTESVEIRLTEPEDAGDGQIDVEVIYSDQEEAADPDSETAVSKDGQTVEEDAKQKKVLPPDPPQQGHRSRRGQDVRITDPYEIARNLGKESATNGNGKSREALKMLIDVLLETYRTTEDFRRDFIKLSLPEQGSFGSSTPEQLQAYLFDPSITEEESLDRLHKLRKKFDDLNIHHQAIMDGYWASITEGREIILENIDLQRIRQEIRNEYFYFAGIRIPQRFIPLYVKKKAYRTLESRVNTLITENRQNFQKKVFWPSFVRAYTKRLNRRKSPSRKRDYQR